MSSKKKAASSARVGDAHEKSTDKLSVKEFRSVLYSKWRTIQRGAPVPPAGVVHGIPPFHQDSTRLHSSQYHPGADGMQHHQHAVQPRPHAAGDSTKGGAKGHVMVRGAWAGSRHPARPFSPNYSLAIPGPEKRGHLVDWVEKASFACLSKLFEIDAKERQCKTLLTARNLMAVVREPQEYRLTLKNAERSYNREKKKNEGTLRKAPGQKRGADSPPNKAPEKEEAGEEWEGGEGAHSSQEFAPPPIIHEAEYFLAAVARLANLADEAASINHPDSPNPDVDAVEAICAARWRKQGQKARVSPLTIRTAGSCSGEGATFKEASLGAQSEGGEVEMVTEPPAVLMVPAEVAPGETHPVPFSYAELEDKLKQIPPGLTSVVPSAKMFEMVESLVSGLRGMANQYDLFTDLLRTTDYMKAFAARHKDTEDQLRLRLGRPKPAYPPLGGE
ncbi:hypothetical protein CK203_060960 [Vitis vinifera]|uniref:Uncharacterized protein n=1 Tax=Vitis vinifera TaxID=29760 RepID=A0A438G9A3_VITVI|nr:hypothetical protein CK203_060960 [Vitis vinifera]